MASSKTTKRAGAAQTKRAGARPASGKKAGAAKSRAAGKARAAAAPSGGGAARGLATRVAGFLTSITRADKGEYSVVFLVNPQQSTPEALRVAWPETCLIGGSWFDFPTAAVESVTPLGFEECGLRPYPKAALKIARRNADLIAMLRSHLTGTIGGEMLAKPPVGARGISVATFEEDVCGSDNLEARPLARGVEAAAAEATGMELSGSQWVARFPGSRSIFDTKDPFLPKISRFHQALVDAGANVRVSATFRPPERAYLMHFSSKIARGVINPSAVPPMPGVNIKWVHATLAQSKTAAQQMVQAYGIAFPPALSSRHTQGLAVDMTITWAGTIRIKDATGASRDIGAPRSGQTNTALHRVGASYGVIKLVSDPPHWSSDGH
jgi:hypothetical protein